MNAASNGARLTYDDKSYYFETFRLTASQRLETTPLYEGGVYRAAAGAHTFTLHLKGRIKHEEVHDYYMLMYGLFRSRKGIRINGSLYADQTLLSGKISSEEGEQYAVCELTFMGVDN